MSIMIPNLPTLDANKIIIFGKNGFLGSYLFKRYHENPYVFFCFRSADNKLVVQNMGLFQETEDWNLKALSRLIHKLEPRVVINAIALANLEKCEKYPLLAFEANAEIPKAIALACDVVDSRMVHISTDAVFGQEGSLFTESIEPVPSSVYGKTKLQGETYVMELAEKHLIIRTNFFGYHSFKSTLFNFFYSNLISKKEIFGYKDVYFNPIYVKDLVLGIEHFASQNTNGLLHFVGNEVLSKFDFGNIILSQIGQESNLLYPQNFASRNLESFRKYDLTLSSNFREKHFLCAFDVNSGITDAILVAKEEENDI